MLQSQRGVDASRGPVAQAELRRRPRLPQRDPSIGQFGGAKVIRKFGEVPRGSVVAASAKTWLDRNEISRMCEQIRAQEREIVMLRRSRSPRGVIRLDCSLADSDNGRGVAAEPDLMISRTDANATPPLAAARCSVQIGRTGAIARWFKPGFDSCQSQCAGRRRHGACLLPGSSRIIFAS